MEFSNHNKEYVLWLNEVKHKIATTQVRVASAANGALLQFYWDLGHDLSKKLSAGTWGSKLIDQLAIDLKKDLPGKKGFSRTNLYYIKQFYDTFSTEEYQRLFVPQLAGQLLNSSVLQTGEQTTATSVPQLGGQLPWGHIKLLLSKVKAAEEVQFYINETISNHWSRDVLGLQIKSDLYNRKGRSITNFDATLPSPQSDLAQQTIKDPYVFDFMSMSQPFVERDIEEQLINHVSKFLLELGKGFAYIGKQYHLEVADQDYYLDLLFYHVILKCYVVIELKNTKFIPEYAGKLNFYLSAVDDTMKTDSDQPSIGILLCRDKNNIEVEFALRGMSQPMGVSEFHLTEVLPEELKSSLPTIEEIEKELEK